jgi:hypothetical protein
MKMERKARKLTKHLKKSRNATSNTRKKVIEF